MGRNYRNFMRVLLGDGSGEPTLFEPLIDPWIGEQLIWRRGEHLWQTPGTYIDTLLSLGERTMTDVIVADARRFPGELPELFRVIDGAAEGDLRFVALCDSAEAVGFAEKSAGVCAVGVYGALGSVKPVIRMDGTVEDALRSGAAGWFAPEHGEEFFRTYGDRLTILGGLGVEYLMNTGPVSIQNRCEALFAETGNCRYAIGSGGCLPRENYLELISLLGVYKRNRR